MAGSRQKAFLRTVEANASALRHRAGVGRIDRLNPRSAASRLGVAVVDLNDLPGVPPEARQRVTEVDPRVWSGMGVPLPDGGLLVVLHPRQTEERANVTIMEELAHAFLGHHPSAIEVGLGGLIKRGYNPQSEKEAYWTAAASLLPSEVVARAVWEGTQAVDLAGNYGASCELVEFRIKTLGLWSEYVDGRV